MRLLSALSHDPPIFSMPFEKEEVTDRYAARTPSGLYAAAPILYDIICHTHATHPPFRCSFCRLFRHGVVNFIRRQNEISPGGRERRSRQRRRRAMPRVMAD